MTEEQHHPPTTPPLPRWLLLPAVALFLALGIDAMAALGVISTLCMAALLFLVVRVERSSGQRPWLPAVFWLLIAEGTGY